MVEGYETLGNLRTTPGRRLVDGRLMAAADRSAIDEGLKLGLYEAGGLETIVRQIVLEDTIVAPAPTVIGVTVPPGVSWRMMAMSLRLRNAAGADQPTVIRSVGIIGWSFPETEPIIIGGGAFVAVTPPIGVTWLATETDPSGAMVGLQTDVVLHPGDSAVGYCDTIAANDVINFNASVIELPAGCRGPS